MNLGACANGSENAIEELTTATGGTALHYDATSGQFIYNWKSPTDTRKCYCVTLTALDGSILQALFKLK